MHVHNARRRLSLGFLLATLVFSCSAQAQQAGRPPIIGRWDMVVHAQGGDHPGWLEVKVSGYQTLVGRFVGQFGSVRPISKVLWENGKLEFSLPPQWESRKDDLHFTGTYSGDKLRGETIDEKGKTISWNAVRSPSLKQDTPPTWGEPRELFSGSSMEGWKPRFADRPNGWIIKDGVLTNEKPGNDLLSTEKFTDFKLHAEFRYPKGSNSGIYLRGRYEVQIEDNYGQEPEEHGIGAIYGYFVPSLNAAKKPGEWQTMDITLVGRVVTVVFNGKTVLDRQTIPGITGGALDSEEGMPGPLLIQGDHGPVQFRKLTLTAVK